ncbi:hypothetical protein J4E93_008050 [Alternaria ventricosa]|uniref:uncharacterized protein n=1 Tax=Alternaria ventricosa TaxID=1187951 RepID=UPI0020C33B84|nr:uncharacterized protein J4E93_008050 [Alternaria ventricosa]KAI4641171.1 hypothetical protein J4E93_008050 [Alternaria ventricosa]
MMVSKNEVAAMVQTELYKLLASEMVYRSRQPVQQAVRPEVVAKERRLAQRTISMTTEELLWTLGVDLGYLSGETEHIFRQSNSLRQKGLGKARSLLSTAQFKHWLRLIRSLITQLLLYPDSPDVELDPLEQSLYDAVSQYNVRALVSLFGSIVGNMDKSKTIICIIDGISDFETPLRGWDREILDVVDQLQNLVHCQRSGPALKLLMTSANKALHIGSLVRREHGEYVSLRSGNVSDRPVRGFGFNQDVQRMLMPSSQQSSFLEPGGWDAQANASQRGYAHVGRPRSSGSNVPGG